MNGSVKNLVHFQKGASHGSFNSLGGKISGEFEAIDMLEAWLNTDYEGGRHDISLDLIAETERKLLEAM